MKKINFYIYIILILIILCRLFLIKNDNLREYYLSKYSGQKVEIIGYISNESQIKDNNQIFIFNINKINSIDENFSIKVQTDRYIKYEYGQILLIRGKLSSPFNFSNDNGRVFDYINFLLKDGIYLEIKKPKITILEGNDGNKLFRTLFKIKKGFIENLNKALGEPHASLAGGLVVGEKSALGNELLDDFRKVGLIHIIVLSGYNITIIADSIRRILSFLPRNISLIIGSFGIILFGILVGGGATVIRSCIMAIIAITGDILRKDYKVSKALFIAGAFMLIHNPLILFYDPSFQLSFLATLGLITLSSPIEKKLLFITERFGIRALIASTLATQIFVSPYILYLMGQLSIIGIIVNILVLPIIPITMFFIAITGILGFVSNIFSVFFGFISHFLLSYELFIVKIFSHLPFAYIDIPKFSFWIVIGFYSIYLIIFSKFSSIFDQFRFRKKSSI